MIGVNNMKNGCAAGRGNLPDLQRSLSPVVIIIVVIVIIVIVVA